VIRLLFWSGQRRDGLEIDLQPVFVLCSLVNYYAGVMFWLTRKRLSGS
jgi:hypothetical protein